MEWVAGYYSHAGGIRNEEMINKELWRIWERSGCGGGVLRCCICLWIVRRKLILLRVAVVYVSNLFAFWQLDQTKISQTGTYRNNTSRSRISYNNNFLDNSLPGFSSDGLFDYGHVSKQNFPFMQMKILIWIYIVYWNFTQRC